MSSTLRELALERSALEAQIKDLQSQQKKIETEIDHQLSPIAAESRKAAGKDTGIVNFAVEGLEIKADLPKKVEWDQVKLIEIGQRIADAGDDPAQYIKTTYGVSETAFKEWPDAIKAVFLPARTVKPGKPKYEILFPTD